MNFAFWIAAINNYQLAQSRNLKYNIPIERKNSFWNILTAYFLYVYVVGQNEILVKMKFLCFIIVGSWVKLFGLEDKGNWASN